MYQSVLEAWVRTFVLNYSVVYLFSHFFNFGKDISFCGNLMRVSVELFYRACSLRSVRKFD